MKNIILLDNIKLDKENVLIENKQIKEINVTGKSKINLFNCNIIDLKIIVNNNSSLEINYFNIIDELDTNINIDVSKESSFTLNHSFINRNTYNLNIKSNFLSEESS